MDHNHGSSWAGLLSFMTVKLCISEISNLKFPSLPSTEADLTYRDKFTSILPSVTGCPCLGLVEEGFLPWSSRRFVLLIFRSKTYSRKGAVYCPFLRIRSFHFYHLSLPRSRSKEFLPVTQWLIALGSYKKKFNKWTGIHTYVLQVGHSQISFPHLIFSYKHTMDSQSKEL